MLQVLILICTAGVSPVGCQIDTASDIVNGPKVASVMECGLRGQTLLAEGTILRRQPGDYAKIVCKHPKTEKTAQKL